MVEAPAALEDFYAQASRLGYRMADGAVDRQRILSVLQAKGFLGFHPAKAAQLLELLREALAGNDGKRTR
jgi:hypothetical protein